MLEHARTPHELASLQRQVFSSETRRGLLSPDAARAVESLAPFHPELDRLTDELRTAGFFELVSGWELRTYMADVLLRDSDAMSMRHSLELRVPFVDRPLLEWLWRQPAAFKFDARAPKSALREALGDLLPARLAAGPKRGFTLPFGVWMKRELRPFLDETFSDASVERCGFLATDAVQRLWGGFLGGADTREWSRVWSLAVLIAFANRRTAPAPASPAAREATR
jgi:asparagine synthase (glutamine-hydrolysing)